MALQPNRVEYGPGTMAIAFTPSTVQPVYSGGISKSSGCQTRQRVPQRAVLENEKSAKPGRSARLAVAATSVAASHSRGRRSERKSSSKRLKEISTAPSPSTWGPLMRSAMALIVLACLISSIVFGEQVDLDHALCLFGMWFIVRCIFSCGQKQREGAPEFV